jgi:hypothetical protein
MTAIRTCAVCRPRALVQVAAASARSLGPVPRPLLALWILSMLALEVQHLKWIVWEHWDCRKHGVKNSECRCKARLILYL